MDPRRDTEVCGEVVVCGAFGILKSLINSIYFYCSANPIIVLLAYLCCFILFSMYTIGFCFSMENVDEDMLTHQPKRNNKFSYQKVRWKHHLQGVKIPTRCIRRELQKKYRENTKWYRDVDGWASV